MEQRWKKGQPVLVLEAMKMEATSGGFVQGLKVSSGLQVSDGSVLLRLKCAYWSTSRVAIQGQQGFLFKCDWATEPRRQPRSHRHCFFTSTDIPSLKKKKN
ncbi:uncharacterized protein LOC111305217 [Durio zibethinus]|uniref:Uncharacterized protein LOC111305217 n=1 Tax=Durio zibethinus TaxID=66656 RepID=A0A6P5ZZW6_DURZI|nr:uncharacterized protein LOC111305217 [Durio zibethinus]